MTLPIAALVILLLPGMTGQVSAQDELNPRARVVRSLLELRQDNVVIQQWDISCGAAALATILNYRYGDNLSEKTIVEAMLRRTDPLRVKFRGGFSLLDLKRFAESQGYTADGYSDVSIENLVEFGPSIVPLSVNGYDHFVVFRGLVGNQVLIADPAFGKRILKLERFREDWLGNLAFVVGRPDGAISVNRLAPQPSDFVRPRDAMLRTATRLGGVQ
jgi:predicted double-glycine peptidase